MERVSVIIPTHNRGHLIGRAISSAAAQTLAPVEIIVVDDASADQTRSVVGEHSLGIPLHYIHLERNRGGGFARNVGVQAAIGDFVAFLDSDDIWEETHLESVLTSCRGQTGDFVASARLSVNGRVLPIQTFNTKWVAKKAKDYVLFAPLAFQTSTLVMPKFTAERVPFDGRLRRHQDWDLMFKVIDGEVPLIQLPQPTVIYGISETVTVSRTGSVVPSLRFWARHRSRMSLEARVRFWFLEIRRREPEFPRLRETILAAILGGISAFELRHYIKLKLKRPSRAQPGGRGTTVP